MNISTTGLCLALLALTGCATPNREPLLYKNPWPKNSDGQYVGGTATVLALIDYYGVPVAACIERSSGNSALDSEAIRRSTSGKKFTPELIAGSPINGYARLPVTFIPPTDPAPPKDPELPATDSCKFYPLAGVSSEELKLAKEIHITISRNSAGKVPETNESWPIDPNGKPVDMDGFVRVLIDPAGHLLKSAPLKPDGFEAFNKAASIKAASANYPRSTLEHWEVVQFQFRSN